MAVALLLVGFVAGWTLASYGEGSARETVEIEAQQPPPAVDPQMPKKDVPGADVAGLPRSPGSVRIEYRREDLGGVVAAEVEYLSPAGIEEVQDFYRGVFRTEGWYVGDVGFSRGAWNFFVIKDEREAFVELKPRGGGLVETDIELTEPLPEEETSAPNGYPEPGRGPASASNRDGCVRRQPAPQQAPASAPGSAPAYDDEAED